MPVLSAPTPNGDEGKIHDNARQFFGNFHKTLPHVANAGGTGLNSGIGDVSPECYKEFSRIAQTGGDFENIASGPTMSTQYQSATVGCTAKLNNPQAGRAHDPLGPLPERLEMPPAPPIASVSTAAELTELYWMALLRDVPFDAWDLQTTAGNANPDLRPGVSLNTVTTELSTAFSTAVGADAAVWGLKPGLDLPVDGSGNTVIGPENLFRCGLPGENYGPFISQFLLQDFNYGAQLVSQTVVPYKTGTNHLTHFPDWLRAQNTGKDAQGNAYDSDNMFGGGGAALYYENPPNRRRITTLRDLARFVNRDALHQAYFNAALQLLNLGAPMNPGIPYTYLYGRQGGFGSLGGPNLLAQVSEVASRALQVMWRQKWLVHRRARPEVYAALLQLQQHGIAHPAIPVTSYGLNPYAANTQAAAQLLATHGPEGNENLLLPLAYSAGSPPHPSYGAGHACVAGACVTILKAWFADGNMHNLVTATPNSKPHKDPDPEFYQPAIVRAGRANGQQTAGMLDEYAGPDANQMTIHGELNKLAANIAMGRSAGGVHYRSDNTRSLRVGERVATLILKKTLPGYAERPLQLDYINFDGDHVVIDSSGNVSVDGDPALTAFYNAQ